MEGTGRDGPFHVLPPFLRKILINEGTPPNQGLFQTLAAELFAKGDGIKVDPAEGNPIELHSLQFGDLGPKVEVIGLICYIASLIDARSSHFFKDGGKHLGPK